MFEGDPQENLKRDLRRLADDVGQLRRELLAGNREKVEQWKESAQEQFTQASEQARATAHDVDQYVKAKPWVAAGVAAAVGAVVGLLLARSKRR